MSDFIAIKVYLDNGNVYEYKVPTAAKAREHADAIIKDGYRSCDNKQGILEHFPPRRIQKVKCVGKGVTTKYPDKVEGT